MSEEKEYTCERLIAYGRELHRCGGKVLRWRGTDGHNGTEWFYTCQRCQVTT